MGDPRVALAAGTHRRHLLRAAFPSLLEVVALQEHLCQPHHRKEAHDRQWPALPGQAPVSRAEVWAAREPPPSMLIPQVQVQAHGQPPCTSVDHRSKTCSAPWGVGVSCPRAVQVQSAPCSLRWPAAVLHSSCLPYLGLGLLRLLTPGLEHRTAWMQMSSTQLFLFIKKYLLV